MTGALSIADYHALMAVICTAIGDMFTAGNRLRTLSELKSRIISQRKQARLGVGAVVLAMETGVLLGPG